MSAHNRIQYYFQRIQKDAAYEEENRRRIRNRGIMEENMRLADARKRKGEEDRKAELTANNQEVDSTLSSIIMTEDPRAAVSALGPNRVQFQHISLAWLHQGPRAIYPGVPHIFLTKNGYL